MSVKKFGLRKLKGTDNNIISLFDISIPLSKIDYELSWSFQGKIFVASTLIYKHLSVGHDYGNVVVFCNF